MTRQQDLTADVQLVANSVPALLAYVDKDGRYVWGNEAYRTWFGVAPDSIRGRHMREVLGETAWAAAQGYVERALAGEEITFDLRIVYSAGPARDVRAAYKPDRDAKGVVRGFVALVSDLSEVRSAERALRHSERLLAESQTAAHVGSWEASLVADGGSPSLHWSDETYRIFGHEPGSVTVDHELFIASIHPDDRQLVRVTTSAGIERGGRFEKEYRIVRPDGSVREIHAWTSVERDAEGRPVRLLGTCQDVTERRVVEREIRETREQLQLIVDATPALIARYDRGARLVWANRAYAERFGKTPAELTGRSLKEIVGEEAFAPVASSMGLVLAGETVDLELEIPYPTLGRRSMHIVVAPTFDAQGAPDGCVGVLTDNTRRRELERERERALQALTEADRRKDEFLAMLSHELRNPMAPILSAVEVLKMVDPRDVETAATARSVIERQVVHMKRLLDDLLDVSRVSQGKIELRRELLDLGAIVLRAAEVSRPLMAEKQQKLSVTPAPEPIVVDADPARLVQVFGNLLNNAAKYSERGGPIDVELGVEGDEAVVRVRDRGIGMSPELLESAFELFVQETRSLDRAQGGMGIGLTMVRSLVKMHGGSVRAFSDGPGRGSEIVVRLPRAPRVAVPASTNGTKRFAPSEHPLRVLVVDDNVDAASMLGDLLGLMGHDVTLAHDGPSALALAAKAPPELVLIDIGLPGMDGYALASALRKEGHDHASLVAVTGYGRDEDLQRSAERGFDHHLVKPVDLAALQRITTLSHA